MFDSIGSTIVRGRWAVIAVWAVIGIYAASHASETVGRLELRGGADEMTEARIADSLLGARFSRPVSEFFAVTLQSPTPVTDGVAGALLDSLIATARAEPWVRGVLSFRTTHDSTFLAHDQRTTFFLVSLAVSHDSVGNVVQPLRDAFQQVLRHFPDREAYSVLVTGRAPLDIDIRTVSAEDARHNERKLVPITLAVLVLAFGALVAALLPVVVGILAITIALTIVGIIAQHMSMSVFVLNMISMIGLGVGIDYSLLVVTRFREELNAGLDARDAARRTFATSGHAVMTSGMTVVVGFAALLLTPLSETKSVGIAGLVVVAVAVLLSTTLLPALLAVLGRAIDRPRWIARRLAWYHRPAVWERWARSLSRHPYRAVILGSSAIALLTIPAFFLRVGLPSRNWWPTETEAGAGVATLERMGMSGYVQPLRLIIEFPEGTPATSAVALRGLKHLSDSLRADPRIRDVKSLVDLGPGKGILEYSLLYSEPDTVRARYPDFLDAYLARDGRTTLMDVIPADTTSLTTTMDVVRDVRALIASHRIRQLQGASIRVGGYVAAALDFQRLLLARFPLIVALILGVTGVMLAVVFRSVLVPIKAIVMNSLSVAATFGIVVLVFQHGIGSQIFGIDGPTAAIYVLVPVIVFAVVFGLSMDYEVFLLARIKEAFDSSGQNTRATREGLSATASVITSAALIMIAVFGAFAFAHILLMQFIGFGLAVAVFLDATLVRMVLVPAFMQIAGRWNWWPGVRDPKEENADHT
ncbi:MAG TPA: MMPL family transporter [Gemmatimonadales bacterium]